MHGVFPPGLQSYLITPPALLHCIHNTKHDNCKGRKATDSPQNKFSCSGSKLEVSSPVSFDQLRASLTSQICQPFEVDNQLLAFPLPLPDSCVLISPRARGFPSHHLVQSKVLC